MGTDDAQQMVCHLSESLRMTLGELAATAKHLPIRYPPLKQLIINVAPFPKNAPTAPELMIAGTPAPWGDDIAKLETLISRFTARASAASGRIIRRSDDCRGVPGEYSSTATWIIISGSLVGDARAARRSRGRDRTNTCVRCR